MRQKLKCGEMSFTWQQNDALFSDILIGILVASTPVFVVSMVSEACWQWLQDPFSCFKGYFKVQHYESATELSSPLPNVYLKCIQSANYLPASHLSKVLLPFPTSDMAFSYPQALISIFIPNRPFLYM